MQSIEFTTDRIYDGPQRITVKVERIVFDLDFPGFADVTATFKDHSRHIMGRVFLPVMPEKFTPQQLQRELMAAYDATQYESI
jgi:hypothetical protein